MIFVGDYFALGLVIILCVFFFDSKISIRHMTAASKLFICCLVLTAATAVTDLLTGQLQQMEQAPLWQSVVVNTLYFVVNIVTTSVMALYLFTKILEHTHSRHCMRNACIGLTVLFIVYMWFVLANLKNGWLFYFDEQDRYQRGPLNALGYIVTLLQLVLVGICYFRNRRNASRPMRRVLLQVFLVAPLCIIIQRTYPEIMLNGFLLALMDTVLFLTFQGQRQGVHALTELNDRHRFIGEVDRRIEKKDRFQLFLINIRNFGSINQKYGHLFGNEYLYQFAFSMEKILPDSLSFHMNGTVFAIIQRYTNENVAEEQSGELLAFMERGIRCMNQDINADYVMVHYVSDGEETNAAELYESLEFAGITAYEKKQRYVRCGGEIREEMGRRRYLRERMQDVSRENGFEVWFQPVQCLKDKRFCSMEALIRLREPDGNYISPGEFIPLAEQTGQISAITWFVLKEVCRILKSVPELENVNVSINLPMTQLLENGFVPRFISIVNQAGVRHRQICIEFTERAILDNFQQTQHIMQQLAQEGFRFYLDDFGTGYSNFNCLLQLPFQIIKLDACLMHMEKNGLPDYTMVRTLTKLFHDMNLVVIAEGAETEEEVAMLQLQGVDRVQGYALAKPMPVVQLKNFYREHPLIRRREE